MAELNKTGDDGKTGKVDGDVQLTALQAKLDAKDAELVSEKQRSTDLQTKVGEADKIFLSNEYAEFSEFKQNKAGKTTPSDDETDFSGMETKDIVAHVTKQAAGMIKAAVDELGGSIAKREEQINQFMADVEVSITASKHPDFDKHKDAMVEISKANPTFGAERLYQEVQKNIKLTAVKEKEDKEDAKKEENKALTEKPGASNASLGEKDLTAEEAAEKAWSAHFGDAQTII